MTFYEWLVAAADAVSPRRVVLLVVAAVDVIGEQHRGDSAQGRPVNDAAAYELGVAADLDVGALGFLGNSMDCAVRACLPHLWPGDDHLVVLDAVFSAAQTAHGTPRTARIQLRVRRHRRGPRAERARRPPR
ncbi:MAG: hypothetical protein ACRDQ7_09225 [Haloechinothrix sp.]